MNRRYVTLLLAAALAFPAAAIAQETARVPRIIVSGAGEAAIAPDLAILSLAVMREAATAREALDQNNEAMAAVIEAMKEAGVEDRDLQTAGLQITPRYVYPQDSNTEEQPRIVAYQVSNSLSVRVRDIEAVGAIIDRSVTLGVNQGGNIVFTNDNPAEATTQARKRAVEDAIARARTLAEAAGVRLGQIVELSERTLTPPPMPVAARAYRMEAAMDAVPVAAGENTYRVEVNVTFEIER